MLKTKARKTRRQVSSRPAKTLSTKDRQAFEQTVLRALKLENLQNKNLLIAVSGGVDSMVLLEIIKQWQRNLGLKITAAYIHHGGKSPYRAKARRLVQVYCEKNNLAFKTNTPPTKLLKSEDELRQYRWAELRRMANECGAADASPDRNVTIATAHHADDLIETQLLRLLRGTGAQGLKAFTSDRRVKPLLAATKDQIRAYAKTQKIKFVEDPSNDETDPLRNWLRQAWLEPLAKRDKQQKSNLRKSLAGSLAALASHANHESWPAQLFVEEGELALHAPTFLQLTRTQKEAALATYMFRLSLKNYTKNHIFEVLKRLDTSKKELTFHLLGRVWHVNAQHITTRSLDIPTR